MPKTLVIVENKPPHMNSKKLSFAFRKLYEMGYEKFRFIANPVFIDLCTAEIEKLHAQYPEVDLEDHPYTMDIDMAFFEKNLEVWIINQSKQQCGLKILRNGKIVQTPWEDLQKT